MKALLFLLIINCIAFNSEASVNAESIFKRFSPNIVQVESKAGTGTGFFINEKVILTNRHVVFGFEPSIEKWNAPTRFRLNKDREYTSYDFMICSKKIDLCAISIEGGKGTERLHFSSRALSPGEDVYVIGHPQNLRVPIISSGVISSNISRLPGRDVANKANTYLGFTTTAPISLGSSGSPVISKSGELLGVILSYLIDSQNINFAISSLEINGFIAEVLKNDLTNTLVLDPGYEITLDKKLLKYKKEVMVASKPKPQVKIPDEEPVVVSTTLDPSVIREQLLAHIAQFRYCYQRELEESDIYIKRLVTLKFTIGAKGKVIRSTIESDNILPQRIKGCLKEVVQSISFPNPTNGGEIDVKQPFNFYPKDV